MSHDVHHARRRLRMRHVAALVAHFPLTLSPRPAAPGPPGRAATLIAPMRVSFSPRTGVGAFERIEKN